MTDQFSSGMIGANTIYNPPEDNTSISRDAQLALELKWLEEDKLNNMEEKEHTIMRDDKLATMIQQQ